MADKTINDLTSASELTGAEIMEAEQSGNSRKVTTALVAALNLIRTVSGTSDTAVLADRGKTVEFTNAGAVAWTIPPNSSVAYPVGTWINWSVLGAGQLTITPGAGVTLRNRSGLKSAGQYAMGTLYKRATDEWVVGGDTTV